MCERKKGVREKRLAGAREIERKGRRAFKRGEGVQERERGESGGCAREKGECVRQKLGRERESV